MKRLVLLRHAKAVAKDGVRDFDRVLAQQGREEMTAVASHLASMPCDTALVSSAARTRETWKLAHKPDVPTTFERSIYEADEPELLAAARGADPAAETAIMVGHNPGFEELALSLTQAGEDGPAADRLQAGFPTAGVAVIEFDIGSWRELARGTGRLVSFETPASLGS